MGYDVSYDLRTEPDIMGTLAASIADDHMVQGMIGDGSIYATWYDHEKEMIELSKRWPDVLFSLHGEADSDDMWDKHFKGGKMQVCQAIITYEEYDEAKLVEWKP
jgi:hypothetical protein